LVQEQSPPADDLMEVNVVPKIPSRSSGSTAQGNPAIISMPMYVPFNVRSKLEESWMGFSIVMMFNYRLGTDEVRKVGKVRSD
jgi:hypothetical protein